VGGEARHLLLRLQVPPSELKRQFNFFGPRCSALDN